MNDWLSVQFDCECGRRHESPIRRVEVESGALKSLPEYCAAEGIRTAAVVCDARTRAVAGDEVCRLLTAAGVEARVTVLRDTRQGEVVADEAGIVGLLLALPPETEAVVAVGSGTLHDIVRFACHAGRRRFLSVPTAPSVDGFASVGAPLVIGGFKNTVPAMAPEAIFADLDVLCRAPREMIAAGYGDILGKYTSLADWKLGQLLEGEHYCECCAELTRQALELCVAHTEDIAAAKPEGIKILTEALILSGISILLAGHSRPASGAEHHLSHFWEMRYLQEGRKALLHGAKVGAATVIISGLYEKLAGMLREKGAAGVAEQLRVSPVAQASTIRQVYGPIAEQVLAENGLGVWADGSYGEAGDGDGYAASVEAASSELAAMKDRLVRHGVELLAAAEGVPGPERMASLLSAVGGATEPSQLGIERGMVEESLAAACFVRRRMTVLRFLRLYGPE